MTLHQVHRLVQLALGATAVGFAALAGTFRKRAPKKPLAGGRLGNAGPEVAFGGREFGADERLGHVLYYTLYKIRKESKSKNTIRICSSLASGLKHQSNQMIWLAKELGCGIADSLRSAARWGMLQLASGPKGRRSRPLFCKKQFAMKMFSGILKALWYSTNRARLWIQPHKAFSIAMKWRAGAC